VRSSEIALRKELALTRMRIARTELALAKAHRRKPDALATAGSAVDLASSLLATAALSGWLPGGANGAWTRWAQIALRVARVVVGVRRAV